MPGGGSKPGERRGGRQKGTPNKSTAELKELAQEYGPRGIARLALMSGLALDGEGNPLPPSSESEVTQLGAIRELLDRGYGKATQPLAGDNANPLFPRIMVSFGATPEDSC